MVIKFGKALSLKIQQHKQLKIHRMKKVFVILSLRMLIDFYKQRKHFPLQVTNRVNKIFIDLSAIVICLASRDSLLSVFHIASVSGDISSDSRNATALHQHKKAWNFGPTIRDNKQ